MKSDEEISFLQATIGHGLEREELRDEIYVQCMRQATGNPSPDMCEKVSLRIKPWFKSITSTSPRTHKVQIRSTVVRISTLLQCLCP